MFSWLPKDVRRNIKGELKRARLAFLRRRRAFSRKDLLGGLHRLGVRPGDVLLVHSSFDRFDGFLGKPTDVIVTLQEAVGPTGTLLMPTLPFNGSSVEYVSATRTFDVNRTPSRMGLLTEMFRRAPGVIRSAHPTHSVAAWGARAEEMLAGHHLATTPCGRHTPYGRLRDSDGKILLLGTDISAMTFFHSVEEELEPRLPFSPFTEQVFSLISRDGEGSEWITETRLFDPEYSRRRNLNKLVPVLRRRGAWKETRIGTLRAILLSAEEVLAACQDMAYEGVYCYDL